MGARLRGTSTRTSPASAKVDTAAAGAAAAPANELPHAVAVHRDIKLHEPRACTYRTYIVIRVRARTTRTYVCARTSAVCGWSLRHAASGTAAAAAAAADDDDDDVADVPVAAALPPPPLPALWCLRVPRVRRLRPLECCPWPHIAASFPSSSSSAKSFKCWPEA